MVVVQTKVEPSILGRVQSVDQLLSTLAIPLAFLIAGPLADNVFEPLLAVDGAIGEQRGVRLLVLARGAVWLSCWWFLASPLSL